MNRGRREYTAPGAEGNLWFTHTGTRDEIGRITSGAPAASVSPPVVSGTAQAGSALSCGGALWSTWAGQQPSAGLYSFDGYQWLLDGSVVASGASYTPTSAAAGHSLSCTETVTYPLLNVTVSAASSQVTLAPAPQAPPGALAPVLSGLRQSAGSWRGGSRLASVSSRRPPVGTVVSFSVNTHAAVTLSFTRSVTGRRVGTRCMLLTHANRRRRACLRYITVGTLAVAARSG